VAAVDLKFDGLYLSAPGGMFTWIGMYPFPVLARLFKSLGSGAIVGGTGLRGLEFPDELLLLRPLSPRRVSLAIKLGALAFFLGGRLNGCTATGSGGGGGIFIRKSRRLSS
jgi:hypothetical protein